jgi:hypothetical protein
VDVKCDDCGKGTVDMSPETLARGSSVRDPGEKVCAGCNSRRVLMLRRVDALPTSLADIRAKRMVS